MLRTLHGKLALALLGLFVLVGVLFVVSTLHTSRRYQQEVSQKTHLELAERLVRENDLMLGDKVAEGELMAVVDELSMTNPGVELYVLDEDGRVLSASVAEGTLRSPDVELEPILRLLNYAPDTLVLGSNPRDPSMRKPFSAARIPSEGPLQGYLYVILGDEAQESTAGMVRNSYVLRLSVVTGLAALLLVFGAGLLLFRFLTRRLKRLSFEMATFTSRVPEDGTSDAGATSSAGGAPEGDEVAQLEAAFADLTRRVSEQMDQLRRADRLRRELLTNVSHDLRTPLAALRGYLETLQMKDGRLSAEDTRTYLDVAAKHGERLDGLISELFELARLDADEASVAPEPFPLSELVQDVVQKYQLRARRKDVELCSEHATSLPFVVADIGMIERLLTNLIDNALRHTPAGGSIRVLLRAADGSVEAEVADTGGGIAAEDLPYIFDRFYRVASHDPRDDGQGAGLGLAIAKRILELHGRQIRAVRRPGGGTAFVFRLPALSDPGTLPPR